MTEAKEVCYRIDFRSTGFQTSVPHYPGTPGTKALRFR